MVMLRQIARCAVAALVAALVSSAALATPVSVVYVGAWDSTGSGNPAGSGGPGVAVGQKFVVRVNYDDVSTRTDNVDVLNSFFAPSGDLMSTVDLTEAGNSLDVLVPMEGLDSGSPFIYTQTEADHVTAFISAPTLNFVNGLDISDANNIVGLEFEGDFAPGAGFNIIEMFNTSPGGGAISMRSQILACTDAFCNGSAIAATDTNGLQAAVDLVVDAGPAVVYDAATLVGSTAFSVTQSNDLGAGRSDGEDFVDAAWSSGGNPLVGTAAGDDLAVAIENSGLTTAASTATWTVDATEQMTLKTASDSLGVSYDNAGPAAEAGPAIQFSATSLSVDTNGATVSDADLAVNAVIGGFESLDVSASAGGNALPGATVSGTAVSNPVVRTIAIADSGLTMTTSTSSFDLAVTDLAGANAADSAVISYLNAVPTASASATATATGIDFTLSADDMDLIVNTLIAGFEALTVTVLVDSLIDATSFFADLIANGVQQSTSAALEAEFGLGAHTALFSVADKAGSLASANARFNVLATQVPEPGPLSLLLIGSLALVLARRRRHTACNEHARGSHHV